MNQPSVFTKWQELAPQFKSLLRIVSAIMFMTAGTIKLFGWPMSMPASVPPINLFSEVWFAGILEVFGGGLVLIGLCTRPIAFVLAGEMAVAYFQVHASNGLWPVVNGGTDAVLYCFIWLYFSAAGAGAWSIDARRRTI